jgi:uncharacterized Zn finger protein (UPF0148 family)
VIQYLIIPLTCDHCGSDYYEQGYAGDTHYCPACATRFSQADKERRRALKERALAIDTQFELDLDSVPDSVPRETNAGRKTVKYESAYGELLVEAASNGESEYEFAARINVSRPCLNKWAKIHPRFAAARKIADDTRKAWLARNYRLAMMDKIPCQNNMMIKLASWYFGWTEKTEQQVQLGGQMGIFKLADESAAFPTETLAPEADPADETAAEDAE